MSSSLPLQPEFLGSLGSLPRPAGQVGSRVNAPEGPYPLLDSLAAPQQVRHFTPLQLEQLATEVRAFLIASVSETGGHFSSNLGTVELTVALFHNFDFLQDRIVWDVGHQAYPHKILTGRRDRFPTLRQHHGLSGFLKRDESPYDHFGAGHASTSISAALGMAKARDLQHQDHAWNTQKKRAPPVATPS